MKNTDDVIKFIATASLRGLESVMLGICEREFSLTLEEASKLQTFVKTDLLRKHVGTKAASEDNDTTFEMQEAISKVLAAASWNDLKRVIHAVNLRVSHLPKAQIETLSDMLYGSAITEELGLQFQADRAHFVAQA